MRLHSDAATVEQVVALLASARRIYLLGEGSSAFLAEAFATRLLILGREAHLLSSDLLGQSALIALARPGDLFIGLGMTLVTSTVAVVLKMARAAGAHTVGIVNLPTNPVAEVAEYVLQAPTHTIGILPSLTAFAALLHALVQALSVRLDEPVADWAMSAARYLREYTKALRTQLPGIAEIVQEYSALHRDQLAAPSPESAVG